jgi:putative ABC transport system permease protein
MRLNDIALKSIARRKVKAGFILAGLAIGVATTVAVITFADAMTEDINHKLEMFGANILVVPRTDNLPLTYGGMTLGGVSFKMEPIRQSDLSAISTIKNAGNIAAVGPVVLGKIRLPRGDALLAGIDFDAAAILKPWWKIQGTPPAGNQLVAGADAARILSLTTGDHIAMNGRELRVSGVLEPTGSQDDQLLFTGIPIAQSILNRSGEISLVEVAALCTACPIEEMVRQIAEKLPDTDVMAIQQVVKGRMETLAHFRRLSYGLSLIVILIGGLVVLVTLLGSVKERTTEIGIMRAIGFRRRHVMKIVFLEAGFLSALAGVGGYLVGTTAIWIAMWLTGAHVTIEILFNPVLATGAVALSMGIGMAASVYPALVAARLDPNQALATL